MGGRGGEPGCAGEILICKAGTQAGSPPEARSAVGGDFFIGSLFLGPIDEISLYQGTIQYCNPLLYPGAQKVLY